MFVDFLSGYIGPLSCVILLSVEQLFMFEDVVPIYILSLHCLFSDPH